jgi:hypothetical protein
MGDADDIKKMMTSATKKWTKQRKAEERNSRAVGMRRFRMTSAQEASLKEAAAEIMEKAYMKASGNGRLPANARQIMYAARGYIQNKTKKPLQGATISPKHCYQATSLNIDRDGTSPMTIAAI